MAYPERFSPRITEEQVRSRTFELRPPTGDLSWEPVSHGEYTHFKKYFETLGLRGAQKLTPLIYLSSCEDPLLYRVRRDQIKTTQINDVIPTPQRGDVFFPTYFTVDLQDPSLFPVRIFDIPPVLDLETVSPDKQHEQRLYFLKQGAQTTDDEAKAYVQGLLARTNRILTLRTIEPFPPLP